MHTQNLNIKKHVDEALADSKLRKAVFNATTSTAVTRQKTIDTIPYWEELRTKTNEIKKDVIENLDHYLELFEKKCKENGINIHWAVDGDEAKKIILLLAKKNNVKRIISFTRDRKSVV